jgi:hypothetical protein
MCFYNRAVLRFYNRAVLQIIASVERMYCEGAQGARAVPPRPVGCKGLILELLHLVLAVDASFKCGSLLGRPLHASQLSVSSSRARRAREDRQALGIPVRMKSFI